MKSSMALIGVAIITSACTSVEPVIRVEQPRLSISQRPISTDGQQSQQTQSYEYVVTTGLEANIRMIQSSDLQMDSAQWIVFEKPRLKPTQIEAIAGADMRDGILISVYFDTDKSEIKNGVESLKLLSEKLKNINGEVSIFGFTDVTGTEARNNVLALERAKAVADQLIAFGVNEKRLKPVGSGTSQMYSDLSKNRRSSIFLKVE